MAVAKEESSPRVSAWELLDYESMYKLIASQTETDSMAGGKIQKSMTIFENIRSVIASQLIELAYAMAPKQEKPAYLQHMYSLVATILQKKIA